MGVFGWSYPPGCNGPPEDIWTDFTDQMKAVLNSFGIEDVEIIVAGMDDEELYAKITASYSIIYPLDRHGKRPGLGEEDLPSEIVAGDFSGKNNYDGEWDGDDRWNFKTHPIAIKIPLTTEDVDNEDNKKMYPILLKLFHAIMEAVEPFWESMKDLEEQVNNSVIEKDRYEEFGDHSNERGRDLTSEG